MKDAREETGAARTLVFDVPGWPGHLAGQHVDIRLTAEDGYSTERSYSIAAPADREQVVLTVQRVPDGEVSPYLVEDLAVGDEIELRGPVGGWFIWSPRDTEPVLLVAGGSGVVPLMAMIRARAGGSAPFKLVYSVRSPGEVYYAQELSQLAREDDGLDVSLIHTRSAGASDRPPGRIGPADLAAGGWPPEAKPRIYVCGPTGFVEAVVTLLLAQGHDPSSIRTERFGPTGR
ncbi:MAG: ferredoxin reductase [Actinoallomurus sp.]